MLLMTETRLFTRADLAKLKGVDNYALQFWFRKDLLIPAPAGPRQHRRFAESEAKICAVLGAARLQGLNAEVLREISETLREAIDFQSNLLAKLGSDAGLEQQGDATTDFEEACLLSMAWSIQFNEGGIGVSARSEGGWTVRKIQAEFEPVALAEVVFDLGRILAQFEDQA